jgi:hypothetical protein
MKEKTLLRRKQGTIARKQEEDAGEDYEKKEGLWR